MLGGMESRMKRETEEVKEAFGHALGELGVRLDKTEKRLDGLTEEMNCIVDTRLAQAIGQIQAARKDDEGRQHQSSPGPSYALMTAGGRSPAGRGQGSGPVNKDEWRYWECRKSLRLRPVTGGNDMEAVRQYMREALKIGPKTIEDIGSFTTQRVPAGPGAKFGEEVVVTHRSVEARDAVKSSAKNLAGRGQEYGVRLEIPNRLKTAMNALQSASFEIKQRHPEARRNVLLEDESMDLVLDFCIREGEPWRRMTSKQARARKARSGSAGARLTVQDDELDRILNDKEKETP